MYVRFADTPTVCEHFAVSELLAAAFSAFVPLCTGVLTTLPLPCEQVHGDRVPVSKPPFAGPPCGGVLGLVLGLVCSVSCWAMGSSSRRRW